MGREGFVSEDIDKGMKNNFQAEEEKGKVGKRDETERLHWHTYQQR